MLSVAPGRFLRRHVPLAFLQVRTTRRMLRPPGFNSNSPSQIVLRRESSCVLNRGAAAAAATSRLATTTTRCRRSFASSSWNSSSGRSGTLFGEGGYTRWKVLARIVRYVRIPVLVYSVYSLGYQQGIIEYARNPAELQEALLDSILIGVGCTDRKDVYTTRDNESSYASSALSLLNTSKNNNNDYVKQVKYVANVGGKIMVAAQQLAFQKRQETIEAIQSELPDDIPPDKLVEILNQNEDYQMWTTACEQLNANNGTASSSSSSSWTYMLIDSSLPNAFVTEILPRHIFITTAMLNMIANPDELALVLGHELSHMILGHISEKNMLETMLRTVEVLLLSMDPTTGLLSLAFVGALATLRTAFTAAHSRDHEHQADEMGIQLAAMACFDTHKAAAVFRKMHEQHIGAAPPSSGRRLLSFADTHPPSEERYQKLILASTTENVDKYADTTCASIGSRLRTVMAGSSSSSPSNSENSDNRK